MVDGVIGIRVRTWQFQVRHPSPLLEAHLRFGAFEAPNNQPSTYILWIWSDYYLVKELGVLDVYE